MSSFVRRTSNLSDKIFDILVIGGGIVGSTLAYEASLRGLKIALIEKNDFGGATTAGNFKTLHGGLRYLQHLDFARLYESVEEQRRFRILAPHLVEPLPFLVPCYGYGMKGREVLNVALHAYEILTKNRNRGVSNELKLPNHSMLSRDEVLKIAPGISRAGLRGGVVFYDAIMRNSDRLTLAFLKTAARSGAICANYIESIGSEFESRSTPEKKIRAVKVRDTLNGDTFEIQARVIVNTAGPWQGKVAQALSGKSATPSTTNEAYSKGLQLVVPKIISHYAITVESRFADRTAVMARGNRSYFFLPWRNATIIGTADIVYRGDPDEFQLTREEGEKFLEEVREAYASEALQSSNIRAIFGGLRPIEEKVKHEIRDLPTGTFGSIEASHRDVIIDHRDEDQIENLFSVVGIKYTTARKLADKVLARIRQRNLLSINEIEDELSPLVGAGENAGNAIEKDFKAKVGTLVTDQARKDLIGDYGSEALNIAADIVAEKDLAVELSDSSPTLAAQITYAIRNEMALRLEDIVMRRTALGVLGDPGGSALEVAARIAAKELNWSESRLQAERLQVRRAVTH